MSEKTTPWLCPRCQRYNAPWVPQCPCQAAPAQSTSGTDGWPPDWHRRYPRSLWPTCPNCGAEQINGASTHYQGCPKGHTGSHMP